MPHSPRRAALHSALAFALLAGGSATIWTTRHALAQAQENERVDLIMGGLPAAGSAEYKALLKLAGPDAKGQILPLTKCEVWSIRRRHLAGLRKAATEKSVSVKELDESWNSIFAPMQPGAPMDQRAQTMMDHARKSGSTTDMGMMSARTASMVEYALTKDMANKAQRNPMSVKITLKNNLTVTAIRRSVVIEGDRCIWRGVIEGSENPVTIMWWGNGRITGTIHTGEKLYQLKHLGNDTIGIVETAMDKIPDEHARASPERMQRMQMQDDRVYKEGDASRMRPKRSEVDDAKDARDAKGNVKLALRLPTEAKARGKAAPGAKVVIDVMVAYTAKAAANYGDIRRDLIELAIEETNQSFRASKIDNVAVRLVHTHETDYKEDGAEHFDHVWRMVDRGDGYLEEIPRLRDEKKADVVILVVDDPSGCGLATRVAADADEAYAVVHHECAATSYSIAHEIGHILGARHDRGLDDNKSPFAYGHGYVSPDLKWRTMMSYKASCNGCPRLPIWSSPRVAVKGQLAGDGETDNSRVIRSQAERVAAFR